MLYYICETAYEYTTGQISWRGQASGFRILGGFGSDTSDPLRSKEGYAAYRDIQLPRVNPLYLRLRYAGTGLMAEPILIYLDNEPEPRASIVLKIIPGEYAFTWSEQIFLGEVYPGNHTLLLYSHAQNEAVVDLDKFILTSEQP